MRRAREEGSVRRAPLGRLCEEGSIRELGWKGAPLGRLRGILDTHGSSSSGIAETLIPHILGALILDISVVP